MNRYSIWRYLLIILITVIGVLYALPVLYGEDPSIQVRPKQSESLPANTITKISDGLNSQKISYLSIKPVGENSISIRFQDPEAQLKAQDVVQAILGPNYAVALNLSANTPEWLQAIGARPMKLGLDLRGGIHFLLQVVVKAAIGQRVQGDVHAISNDLREAQIRYAGIMRSGDTGIIIRFRDDATRTQALNQLKRDHPDYDFTTAMLNGQYLIKAEMTQDAIIKLEQYAVTQNITTLRNRVNELGVSEPVIQQQGKDFISVDLPGVQDMARAKSMLGKVATVQLQLVDTEHDASAVAKSGIVPFGTTLYKDTQGQPVLLQNRVILSGTSIISAVSAIGQDGRPSVNIEAGGPDVATFNRITAANVNKPLAVLYVETQTYKQMVDGKPVTKTRQIAKVINVASINSALGNRFVIQGLESMEYAKDLALLLRSGAYVAPVAYVQERLVGPSLGKENIRMGVLSTEIGALLVFVFMLFYYLLFGVIADIALILNVVFLIAVMAIMGFTLTLPGIAGIVLTLGMAVDANVLINERIREELRNGMSPQAAIHAGYERAFTTIVDSNLTTLIVAVVLFALGTGPVKGFAVTLSIGLLLSMMTSIFFTRALVNLIYGQRQVKHLSIGIKIKPKEK